MSWLRDHFYTFVFPAFLAAEKLSGDMGTPFDVKPATSAPSNLPLELKKLWTLCQEHGLPWSDNIQEGGIGSSIFRQSAKLHGTILRNTLDSAVTSMRMEKAPRLLFAGRDVWALAVLAERRGVPYTFVPEISRRVARDPAVLDLLTRYNIQGNELLVDTGFVGSIPLSLQRLTGRAFPFRLMSQNQQLVLAQEFNKQQIHPQQLFPNRKAARSEALETEYLAKYWKTGTVQDNRVVQYLATRTQIQRAALLTSQLWRGRV